MLRPLRALLAFVVVLGVLFVAVDRLAWYTARQVLASRIQKAEHLSDRPQVGLPGFPFLTQVARQRYTELDVTANNVLAQGITLSQVHARLFGLRVPTSALLAGHLRAVPVDRVDASALVSWSALDAALASHDITVGPAGGGRVRLAGPLSIAGQRYDARATASVRFGGDTLLVTATSVDVTTPGVASGLVSGVVRALAKAQLRYQIPLSGLPFGLTVDTVRVGNDGVAVAASAGRVVIPVS